MRVHILQHVIFEGPANIANWARLKGHDLTLTKFFEPNWSTPAPESVDLLIILGGPMGVYDESSYPWLAVEKSFIRNVIDIGRPVFGICLGAQLLADALGAKVYPNPNKEIGWFPIQKTNVPHPVFFDMAPELMVFHWHSDTFDLPTGALHLATSEACPNQAFIWNEQVMGVQFHIEMSAEHVEQLEENCFQELKESGPYVQSDAVIRKGFGYAENLPPLMDSILTRFAS